MTHDSAKLLTSPMKKILLSFLFLSSLLYSKEPEQEKSEDKYEPIFAGLCLHFSLRIFHQESGSLNPTSLSVRPMEYIILNGKTKPIINNFESQLLLLVETGITPWLDITLTVNENYTSSHGRKSYLYGDTRLALGFQITTNKVDGATPDFRIVLFESFPTGKYQHLDPKKTIADVSGSGAFETWIVAILRKIIYFTPRQVITVNLNLGYDFPSSVHVRGFNLYGGGPNANGSIKPGQQFLGNLALEYSLTENWILGCDLHYVHQNTFVLTNEIYTCRLLKTLV